VKTFPFANSSFILNIQCKQNKFIESKLILTETYHWLTATVFLSPCGLYIDIFCVKLTRICYNIASSTSEVERKVVLLSDNKQPVGLGQIVSGQDVHLQAIPAGYIKVIIDYVVALTRPYL